MEMGEHRDGIRTHPEHHGLGGRVGSRRHGEGIGIELVSVIYKTCQSQRRMMVRRWVPPLPSWALLLSAEGRRCPQLFIILRRPLRRCGHPVSSTHCFFNPFQRGKSLPSVSRLQQEDEVLLSSRPIGWDAAVEEASGACSCMENSASEQDQTRQCQSIPVLPALRDLLQQWGN